MHVQSDVGPSIAAPVPGPGGGAPPPIQRQGASARPVIPPPGGEAPKEEEDLDSLKFSKRFSALSKKDREIKERQQKMKEREEQYTTYESLKSDPKTNALKILDHFGLSYEDITSMILADPDEKPTTEDQVLALQKRLDDEAAARKKAEEDEANAQNETLVNDAKVRIKAHVESKGDEYELIRINDAHEMVWDVVEDYFDKHGVLPTIDEACGAVENYLENSLKPSLGAKKFSSTSTSQKPPVSAPQARELRQNQNPPKKQSPTLSADALNVSQPYTGSNGSRVLTRDERIRAAAQKLTFK